MPKVEEAFDIIKGMTIIELRDLNKKIEDEFGIVAAAPAMMMAPGAGAGAPAAAAAEEEKTEFNVILKEAEQDQRDQGRARSDDAWSQGSEGPGRERARDGQGRHRQGGGRGREDQVDRGRRDGRTDRGRRAPRFSTCADASS